MCVCLSVPRLWFVPFMLWLGEVIINAKATLAFQMLFFFLFKRNKQTNDNHLFSAGSKWIQNGGHCSVSIETQDTSPPLMFLSLLVWMTDFLDQSVPRVFNNKRLNSRRTRPKLISSLCQSQLTVQSYTELCSQCFSAIHTTSIYSTSYSKLPSNHFTFITPHPSTCSQHIHWSLFLINLLHTEHSHTSLRSSYITE